MHPRRLPLLLVAIGFVAAAIVGCSEPFNAAAALNAKKDFTDADIRHFLTRTHFGDEPGRFDMVRTARTTPRLMVENPFAKPGEGLPAYVDHMLNYPVSDPFNPIEQWEVDAYTDQIGDIDFPNINDIAEWWLQIMVRTENPFQEVLAMAWHDHFAASSEVLNSSDLYWMFDHINLWRKKGNGNLKDLLFDMCVDWLMVRWLDGVSSTNNNPNENFAREFYELFTLGVDNGYTQNDIVETSRAFTGFRTRNAPNGQRFIEFDPTRHDTGTKTIFGVPITGRTGADGVNEYKDVIDLTLRDRDAAQFICNMLFEYFCYKNPDQALIDALALILQENDWELRPVLRTIFLSEAFYGPQSQAGLVKSPLEYAVGFIRSTGLEITMSSLRSRLGNTLQIPSQPPSVNGWPEGSLWLTGQGMLERTNLVNACITSRSYQASLGINLDQLLPAPALRTPNNIVRNLVDLFRLNVTQAEFDSYITYLNSRATGIPPTVTTDPFDGENATHLDERVRGLIYILAQHPSYHIR